jgi:hypothetical protein
MTEVGKVLNQYHNVYISPSPLLLFWFPLYKSSRLARRIFEEASATLSTMPRERKTDDRFTFDEKGGTKLHLLLLVLSGRSLSTTSRRLKPTVRARQLRLIKSPFLCLFSALLMRLTQRHWGR